MDKKWIGLAVVALLAGGVVLVKQRDRPPVASGAMTSGTPQVLLLADMSEAGGEDNCAKIIRAVEVASERRVKVATFGPGDASPLLQRYSVLVNPTVLVLTPDGKVAARFEGESAATVAAIEARLAQIRPTA